MDTSSISILVIDDDVFVADMLIDVLQVYGIAAMAVYSGAQALEVLNKWQPKAIILDIRMPGLDGYETAKAIRSIPEWKNVAIIALSGWHGSEPRFDNGSLLFDRCLTKPAKFETIIAALDSVLTERASAPDSVLHSD